MGQDLVGGLGPNGGVAAVVPTVDEGADRGDELLDAVEGSASDRRCPCWWHRLPASLTRLKSCSTAPPLGAPTSRTRRHQRNHQPPARYVPAPRRPARLGPPAWPDDGPHRPRERNTDGPKDQVRSKLVERVAHLPCLLCSRAAVLGGRHPCGDHRRAPLRVPDGCSAPAPLECAARGPSPGVRHPITMQTPGSRGATADSVSLTGWSVVRRATCSRADTSIGRASGFLRLRG